MLIEIAAMGDSVKPYFDQTLLQFEVGKEYLLRIDNGKPFGVTLYYDTFGQKVATYYLQGVPSVSQASLDVPANSKALWHLMPLEVGEFYFMAMTSESGKEKAKKVQVRVVKDLEETTHTEQLDSASARKLTLFQKRK